MDVFGTFGLDGYKKIIKTKMFIFADFSVTDLYEEFMQKLLTDSRYEHIETIESTDMQGTITRIITYSVIVKKSNIEENPIIEEENAE